MRLAALSAKNLGEQNAYGLLRLVTILSFAAGMAGVAGYVAINLLGDKKPTEKQQTVPLPSGTGWIFAGYFDPQKSQWADEHYVDHAGAPCDPGWIGGKVRIVDKERHIVIVGYKETGWKSYETSPVSSYKEDRDITDVVVPVGYEMLIRDVTSRGYAGRNAACWLRIANP